MKIMSIEPAGSEDVYNMEVAVTHDYAIENGVISHNCRYVCMANPIAPPIRVQPKPKPYDPLSTDDELRGYSNYEFYKQF